MARTTLEQLVLPPEAAMDDLVAMMQRADAGASTLSGPHGEQYELPPELFALLRDVVFALAAGQAVTVAPVNQRLTTQQAADLLGISRPTFVKLLDEGEIAFEVPGRHRRVRLDDVLEYRKRRSVGQRRVLDEMVEIAHDSDMYEKTERPVRTR